MAITEDDRQARDLIVDAAKTDQLFLLPMKDSKHSALCTVAIDEDGNDYLQPLALIVSADPFLSDPQRIYLDLTEAPA